MGVRNVPPAKRFKFGFRVRLIIVFCLAVVLVTLIGVWIAERKENQALDEEMQRRLVAVAQLAASELDGDQLLEVFNSGDGNTEAYRQIQKRLLEIRKLTGMHYIYTMVKGNDDQVLFVVDGDEEPTPLGEPYPLLPEMAAAFAGQATAEANYTVDQWGRDKSGYAPVFNREGRVVAIVGVDANMDNIFRARRELFISTLIPIGLIAIVFLILVALTSNAIIKPLDSIVRQFDQMARTADLTLRLGTKTYSEYAPAVESINHFLDDLCYLIARFREAADRTDRMVQSLSNRMHEQWESSGEIASLARQIQYKIGVNTQRLDELAQQMRDMAGAETEQSGNLIELASEMKACTGKLEELVQLTNQQAIAIDEITAILANLSELSEQLRKNASAFLIENKRG